MSNSEVSVLNKATLHEGGFAGLREHRLVMSRALWGSNTSAGTWDGIGNFVYLADARFQPKGETTMHPHKEIDVISIMVEGRIAHEGSLEHGGSLEEHEAQVQRAGGEGFSHNEVNPDETYNRMLQLWVTPETAGQAAAYKKFSPKWGETTRIYGGIEGQTKSFPAETRIDVVMLNPGQAVDLTGTYLAYLSKGTGRDNEQKFKDGDLFRGADVHFEAEFASQLIIIRSS
ncbi:pilus assembly protein [Rhodospirillales bacterium 47_12_T64]|nr:pilus assembly protein [Rhodospirillales bacterium 47_12_T64]